MLEEGHLQGLARLSILQSSNTDLCETFVATDEHKEVCKVKEGKVLAQGRIHLQFKVCLRRALLERCAKRRRDEDISILAPLSTRGAAE